MRESEPGAAIGSGHSAIDGQHHVQIDLLTAFRRSVAAERPRADVEEILERLIDFTKVHFHSEQLLMRLYQYPAYQQHCGDHDATVDQLQEIGRAYAEGRLQLACDTADRLGEQLLDHIRTADRALGAFLVRLGVA
jgi:hemerythrin